MYVKMHLISTHKCTKRIEKRKNLNSIKSKQGEMLFLLLLFMLMCMWMSFGDVDGDDVVIVNVVTFVT